MQYEEVSTMLESTGIPCAYYQFPEDTEQKTPFICFYYPESSDFMADNENYVKIEQLTVELYQDSFDDTIEALVEAALKAAGFAYTRERVAIDSEKLYETIYQTEVLFNG